MPLRFDEKRATQATARVLNKRGTISSTLLVHTLYLIDRHHIREEGMPFIGTTFYGSKHGPCSREIDACIAGIEGFWSDHIETVGTVVQLTSDPGLEELNNYQIELIDAVALTTNHLGVPLLAASKLLPEFELGKSIELEHIWQAQDVKSADMVRFRELIKQW